MERVLIPDEISETIIELLQKAAECDDAADAIKEEDIASRMERVNWLEMSVGYTSQIWALIKAYRPDLFSHHYSLEGDAKGEIYLILETTKRDIFEYKK